MKKFFSFVTLTLLAFACFAKDIGYISNKAGGRIVFTNTTCVSPQGKTYEGMYQLNSYDGVGKTDMGCYYLDMDSGNLKAVWEDGSQYTYPVENVILFNKSKSSTPL